MRRTSPTHPALPARAANRRARRTAAASAALVAALALAGCGASQVQPDGALPTGAAPTAAAATQAAVQATLPAGSPKFDIPADLTLDVDADATGDPAKDAVLLDAEYQFYAFVEAISAGDAKDANFRAWTVGDAYTVLSASVNSWKARGQRLSGLDHLSGRTVTIDAKGTSAVYTACEDSSQAYPLTVKTGAKGTNTAGTGNYTLWQGTFVKQASNTWVLDVLFTKPGASQCAVG